MGDDAKALRYGPVPAAPRDLARRSVSAFVQIREAFGDNVVSIVLDD